MRGQNKKKLMDGAVDLVLDGISALRHFQSVL